MDKVSTLFRSPWTVAVFVALAIADLWLIPAEQTLGGIIKVIFLHGALVEVGLVIFLLGGLVGLAYVVWRTDRLAHWGAALQKTGVILWIFYALSSMLSTKLAWGQWIAWDEPRVRASAMVLGFVIVSLLFSWWVGSQLFTALANVAVTGVAFYLIKGASLLQHPFDPIGTSSSHTYRLYFGFLLLIILVLAMQLTLWLRSREPSSLI
ncbi:hypothetical protein GC175_09200 [bacterium]|nr:hypothetical protein [bacterium]